MHSLRCSFLISLAVCGNVPLAFAAEDSPEPSESVRQIRAVLADYRANLAGSSSTDDVKLSARPLLTFGDAARNNEAGTLWTWTVKQRPVAFVEVFRPSGDPTLVHALTLASEQRIELKLAESQTWRPGKTQRQPKRCPADVATVADSPIQRLRQMKDISRHFHAHEFWDPNNSRFELRLLVQPVYRYQDDVAKIVDAGVFALAHGTNPEVLVLIEAVKENDTVAWHYDFLRLGSAEIHVLWDEEEVWTVPRTPGVVGLPIDPYWLAVTPNPARTP
jgi:hypothetical protein